MFERRSYEVIDLKKDEKSCMCLEFSDFTPLMLAVVSPHQNLEVIELFILHCANLKAIDCHNNNLVHLAVMYSNNKVLDYLL